jgi:transposase-like protein
MRGRHSLGPELANGAEGSASARRRLQVMLETISGQKRIADACEELGIGEAQFHKLRNKMLNGALASLEPGVPGRPAAMNEADNERVAEMQDEIRQLKIELRASQIREEIALLMPHLVKVPEEVKKKAAKKAGSGGGKGDTQNKSEESAS